MLHTLLPGERPGSDRSLGSALASAIQASSSLRMSALPVPLLVGAALGTDCDAVGALLGASDDDGVGALVTVDGVGALVTVDIVGALVTVDGVGALVTVDGVGALVTVDGVGALVTVDGVGALVTVDGVGALVTADGDTAGALLGATNAAGDDEGTLLGVDSAGGDEGASLVLSLGRGVGNSDADEERCELVYAFTKVYQIMVHK